MSLLPVINACRSDGQSNPEYYFALSGGSVGPVRDSSFVAIGSGNPPNGGGFTAINEDTVGNGTNAYIISDISGVRRWAFGVQGVEAGANSGSDMILSAYNDAGVFLNKPLTFNRASGQVVVNTGLTVDGDAVFTGDVSTGLPTTVGGGNIEVVGTLGVSRVYDAVYNPPEVGADVLLFTAPADGVTPITANTYTPARTGLHIVSLTIQANAAGFAWTPGSAALLYGLTYNAGANIEAGAQLYCSLITNPAGMGAIGPIGPNVVEYQNDILVNLTAGRTYAIAAASSGAPNLGAGGNVAVVVQPVYA
jgi:hypothetical protein